MISKSLKQKQRCKEYYQKNKSKRIKQITEWQKENFLKTRLYSKTYYYKNREEINKKKRFICII